MKNSHYFQSKSAVSGQLSKLGTAVPKKLIVGIILTVALLAFEMFNFDTSQYALRSLLGEVQFLGIQWATILAIAFCAIDFAGLVRIFTPERGRDEPKEVWYLTGAWILGATMNAILTWWAVSLALLNHNFGNEVLSREQLLLFVPIFVAVLVWLTRILFIGAFSVTGDQLFESQPTGKAYGQSQAARPSTQPAPRSTTYAPTNRPAPTTQAARPAPARAARPAPKPVTPVSHTTGYVEELQYEPIAARPAQPMPTMPPTSSMPTAMPSAPQTAPSSRVRQRPPRPDAMRRPAINGVQARPRNQN